MKSNISGNTTILFGMGPAGLFLARQLFRAGYEVIGIGKEDDIGRYSNTLKEYYATEEVSVIKSIIGRNCENQKNITAYICSDQYLTMFLEEWPEIFSLLSFSEPGKEMLELIADKERLIEYCRKIGVSFPAKYDCDEHEERICFPVAIKPNVKRGYSPIAKISVIDNREQLVDFLKNAEEKGLSKNELIIQQYIPGNNLYEYGYGGYFRNGQIVVDVTFMQLRQYPQGVSCYTCEVTKAEDIKAIKNLVMPFIEANNYDGFIQFDIKKHATTGEFYVLDINPRPWGSVSILSPKCESSSIFEEDYIPDKSKSRWRFPVKEAVSFRNRQNVTYKQIDSLLPVGYVTVVDLYDKRDRKPFLMQLPIAFMKIWKKIRWR